MIYGFASAVYSRMQTRIMPLALTVRFQSAYCIRIDPSKQLS